MLTIFKRKFNIEELDEEEEEEDEDEEGTG